jgi:hypothetical protein
MLGSIVYVLLIAVIIYVTKVLCEVADKKRLSDEFKGQK